MHGRVMLWQLRVGDWDADARPRARLQGYDVVVENVSVDHSRSIAFQWGDPDPKQNQSDTLTVQVVVEADGAANDARLAGVRLTELVLDTGDVLTSRNADADWGYGDIAVLRAMGLMQARFPVPPEAARTITELRGKLGLYHSADWGSAEFTADEVGESKPFGPKTCTLKDWRAADGWIEIVLVASGSVAGYMESGDVTVRLVRPDGTEVGKGQTTSLQEAGVLTATYRFQQPEEQNVRIIARGWVLTDPVEDVAFTIENIPLP